MKLKSNVTKELHKNSNIFEIFKFNTLLNKLQKTQ